MTFMDTHESAFGHPTAERGFLPVRDPLTELPAAFAPWEERCAELPRLLTAGRAREAIRSLPTLDGLTLTTGPEYERAMLLLSYLGHAYVFGGREPCSVIPSCVAIPWCAVASRVGRPPVLSYASHALSNWRRFEPSGPIVLDNLARLTNFLGGMDEDWFVLIHVAIEGAAGPALAAARSLPGAVVEGDEAAVENGLVQIGDALDAMCGILRRMPERCDPYIYYRRVRQFIFGWTEIPGGVVYEGVRAYSGAQVFRGETGAQSTIIPALDAVLGVEFDPGDALARHQAELQRYMPPAHRSFLSTVQGAGVRQFVGDSGKAGLLSAYNHSVWGSAGFREQHLKFALSFIANQVQTSSANPVATGTGGTPFATYLAGHVREVAAHEFSG